jgi:hypothetical protein
VIDDISTTIGITTIPAQAFVFRADDLTDIGQHDEARCDYESASRIAKSIQDANVWLELVRLYINK